MLYSTASGFSLAKLTVGACGAGVARLTPGLMNGDFHYDNGRLYLTSGRVIDAEAGTLVGTFDVPSVSGSSQGPLVTTDSKASRIYLLFSDGTSMRLRVFDMKTFVLVGELKLPGVTGLATGLVRWGADGVAFGTDQQVYLLRNQIIAAPNPLPPFNAAPPATPLNFTVRGSVFQLNTPVEGVTVSFNGGRTGTTQTNAAGRFSITDLPLCEPLTITPSKPFWTFTPASETITNPATQAANFSAFHSVVGFVTAQTSASEGQHRVFLPVARSVTSFGAASLSYTVTPVTASGRSDFTAVNGTFHFDPGVAQAPIEILLTDDAFVEGPETFTVTLGDPVGLDGAELVTPTITVTILDNDNQQPTASPLQNSAFFVRRHYHDFLGREPDAAGLAFWTNEIEKCGSAPGCRDIRRINVSAAFFLSIEFQETGYLVYLMYKSAYGDATSPGVAGTVPVVRLNEFLPDTREIGRGVSVGFGDWQKQLEGNKQAFALAFVQRARFTNAFPAGMSAGDFVDRLAQNAGLSLTQPERDQLVSVLGPTPSDAPKRAQVLRLIAEDARLRQAELNRAFVLMEYFGYLRRNPDDAPEPGLNFGGWKFWLGKLEEFHGNFVSAEMVKAFLTSTEYQQRFGPTNFDLSQ